MEIQRLKDHKCVLLFLRTSYSGSNEEDAKKLKEINGWLATEANYPFVITESPTKLISKVPVTKENGLLEGIKHEASSETSRKRAYVILFESDEDITKFILTWQE